MQYNVHENKYEGGLGIMAALYFNGGARNQRLAELILKRTPDSTAEYGLNESGVKVITKLTAPWFHVSRAMISQTLMYDSEFPENTDKLLHYYALKADGIVLRLDRDGFIVADDGGDKLVSLRCKSYHKDIIKALAPKLGLSGNDFILKAIEYYSEYISDAENMIDE